jgi:flagellar biosynthetic protein FliP
MIAVIFHKKRLWALLLLVVALLGCAVPAWAETPNDQSASLMHIDISKDADSGKMSVVMQIFLLMTLLSLAPSILIMLTCFTRIAIVLSLLRQAIGTHQLPPAQIITGLALFLTFFIMAPVWQAVNQDAVKPYLANELTATAAFEKAILPVRQFMIRQTREKDLALLVEVAKLPRPKNIEEVPIHVIIPAFIISELKTAFQIGFMLYIPFLIIDMVVASVLLSMGMMMLPPIMVSLPFKLMIFVLTDGWFLIVGSLVQSYAV